VGLALVAACKHEPIPPNLTPNRVSNRVCDTTAVTYSKTITKLMDESCNVCHATRGALGGVVTDTYEGVRKAATGSRFMGALLFQLGYKAMPLNAPQLDSCDLVKIETWIKAGALNN
jgi:cytochrome c5